jgi:chromosome segregation ATPase
MLFTNETVVSRIGTPLNIVELIHTTTIGTLNEIRLSLGKVIDKLENQDEWTSTEDTQTKLEGLKLKKELVNLIIGYKRFNLENEANARKKAELEAKLKELKESQKTPEDRIKELEAEISQLDTEEF